MGYAGQLLAIEVENSYSACNKLITSYFLLISIHATSFLTNKCNFITMASMKTSGDHYRNYQDDRSAQSQETVYTTSNDVPIPHLYETLTSG
jgi:hypothetical protein